MVLYCDLKLVTETCVLRPLGRGSGAGQGQPLPITGLEQIGRNYKVIRCWKLPMLDLEARGRPCCELKLAAIGTRPGAELNKRLKALQGELFVASSCQAQ